MDHLYQHIDEYLDLVDHPQFKRESTMTLIRRIIGRCNLTWREATTIHGLLRRSEWHFHPVERDTIDQKKAGKYDPDDTGMHDTC